MSVAAHMEQQAGLVPGSEFLLTAKDFDKIAAVLHGTAGIALQENKANLVYSRLAKRLRLLGMKTFSEYCALIGRPEGVDELDAMIAALTTNVTRFFREPHHFEHLRTTILPSLIPRIKQGQRVRLWSAACSSGQEAYSMAMTILALLPDAAEYDVKVLATDIDPNMIALGQAACYDEMALRAVPADQRRQWFVPANDRHGSMIAVGALRGLVTFRRLNLVGAWPMRGQFHAIFCRNVVIYFENDTQAKIWARMVPLLDPAGALYIGHSERVSGAAEALLCSDGITTYRKLQHQQAAS